MKILPLSDLHIRSLYDIYTLFQIPDGLDVIILAGDIVEPIYHLHYVIKECLSKSKHVVFVPGNHEYWGSTMTAVDEEINRMFNDINAKFDSPRAHVLGCVEIDGINFVGSTLWTEFLNQDGSIGDYDLKIGDNYRILDYSNNLLTPEYTVSIHKIHKQFIKDHLRTDIPNIIITHHVPTWLHMNPDFKDAETNPFFMSNLDEFIIDSNAVLWVHGHTHMGFDSVLGNTRIIANPRGYLQRTGNWENPDFSMSHIIEIPN